MGQKACIVMALGAKGTEFCCHGVISVQGRVLEVCDSSGARQESRVFGFRGMGGFDYRGGVWACRDFPHVNAGVNKSAAAHTVFMEHALHSRRESLNKP